MGGEQAKDKRQSTIENLFLPLKTSNRIDSKLYETIKQMVMFLHKGQHNRIIEYFKNKQANVKTECHRVKYFCGKVGKKDDIYYQCNTCSYLEKDVSFCGACFLKEKHLNHDYTAVQNEKQVCCCGNNQLSEESTFCKSHSKDRIQVPLDGKIKRELKLYIQLLIFLKQEYKFFGLQPHIVQYYGQPLLQFLILKARVDMAYFRTISLILLEQASIMTNLQIELKIVGKSLLEDLIITVSSVPVLANLVVALVDEILEVNEVSRDLLRIYYDLALVGDQNKGILNIFNQFQAHPALSYKHQIEYFSNSKNCRLNVNNSLNNIYDEMFQKILSFKGGDSILENILRHTQISEIFGFQCLCSQIVEKFMDQQVSKVSMRRFIIIRKIINKVNDKKILEGIIKETLQFILKKKVTTFDLFFERIFALAVYKYEDFKIIKNNIGLFHLLCSFYPQVTEEKQNMLMKILSVRDKFYKAYQQKIRKRQLNEGFFSLALLANDQLYLKIISTLVFSKEEVISFYQSFILKKILNGKSPAEFNEKGIFDKTDFKEIIRTIKTFFISITNSIIHNADQFIIKGSNGSEESIESILIYLAQIFQGSNAIQFKENAQLIVPTPRVVKFIKQKLTLQGKKIHSKSQTKNIVIVSPGSQFFANKLPEIISQRMINLFCKNISSERLTLFAEEQCLSIWANVLSKCVQFLEKNEQIDAQVKIWLKKIVDSFLELGIEDKNTSIFQLIKKIHIKVSNLPFAAYGISFKQANQPQKEASAKQSSQDARSKIKKLKLQNIRQKQKQVLQNHHMEEQKRVAECIVCKNSKSGNPFLLGHFGYKNIFNKVLEAETPFLEFSSCGHYIHQDCLQESHKGDFKIWYPCILCKSICNILLPNVSNVSESGGEESQQQKLQRVIVFLKNLGGIYTFFYQDRKQLIQFSLQKVQNVFPLLFKTLVYQITFYPLLNLQYFQRSKLPVTKFLFDLLLFTSAKLTNISFVNKIGVKGHPFFMSLYQYVSDRLSLFFQPKNSQMEVQNNLPKDINLLIEEITYCLQGKSQNLENITFSSKEYRQLVVQGFIKPPKDLKQLQAKPQSCASCRKIIDNYQQCLLCGWLCCSKCTQVKKVHALQAHLSQSVFLRNTNGKYTYIHQQLLGEYNSLYVDYLGEEYNGLQKVSVGEYQISKDKWENIVEDLLNNRLHRQIMKVQ